MTGLLSSLIKRFTMTNYSLLITLQELTDSAERATRSNTKHSIKDRTKILGQLTRHTLILCVGGVLLLGLSVLVSLRKAGLTMKSERHRWAYAYEHMGSKASNVYHGADQLEAIERWLLVRFPEHDSLSLTLYQTQPPKIYKW